jgi:hypothetical protein
MGLGEATWVVRTVAEYALLARRYVVAYARGARESKAREAMKAARRRLQSKLLTSPFFDTASWTLDWHRALSLLWDLHVATRAQASGQHVALPHHASMAPRLSTS